MVMIGNKTNREFCLCINDTFLLFQGRLQRLLHRWVQERAVPSDQPLVDGQQGDAPALAFSSSIFNSERQAGNFSPGCGFVQKRRREHPEKNGARGRKPQTRFRQKIVIAIKHSFRGCVIEKPRSISSYKGVMTVFPCLLNN